MSPALQSVSAFPLLFVGTNLTNKRCLSYSLQIFLRLPMVLPQNLANPCCGVAPTAGSQKNNRQPTNSTSLLMKRMLSKTISYTRPTRLPSACQASSFPRAPDCMSAFLYVPIPATKDHTRPQELAASLLLSSPRTQIEESRRVGLGPSCSQ